MTVTTSAATAEIPEEDVDKREPRARSVSFFTFILTMTEPGGVTVPGEPGAKAQAELDRGPFGPQVPGTTLAGALRELVRGKRPGVVDEWFGRLVPEGERQPDEVAAEASRIWVLGSRVRGEPEPFRLSMTAIDRERGAARNSTLRTDEVLPAGTSFEVFLRWDGAAQDDVEYLAGLLAGWRPLVGRGVSRGRGRCEVSDVKYGTLALDTPDGLLSWLTLSGPDLVRAVATTAYDGPLVAAKEPVCRASLAIIGPWHTGGENESRGKDKSAPRPRDKPKGEKIPLLRVAGQPVMPGTGLKGVVRSRAEYILRSVDLQPPVCTDQQCGKCWACAVFGYGGGDDESSLTVGARALIRFADAPVLDPELPDKPVRDRYVRTRTHVAIDRFTGGAREAALYTMEVLEAGTIGLLVEPLAGLDLLGDDAVREIRAVLRLVLDDLGDGIIGLGAGTARGYGSVTVDFGGSGLPSSDAARRELARMIREGSHVVRK